MKKLNVREHLMKQRENTKWRPYLITNVLFVVDASNYSLGNGVTLPDYILNKKSIHALVKDKANSFPYKDNLCAFRCISLHKGQSIKCLTKSTQQYYAQWMTYKERKDEKTYDAELYPGIQLHELSDLEECFQVNINAYELRDDDAALCVYKSLCNYKETMYLNIYENHLSYIKNFQNYARKYQCDKCERFFEQHYHLKRHMKTCTNETKFKYPGGFVRPPMTIFEKLEECDIWVPEKDRTFTWYIVYDFEAILEKLTPETGKLVFTNKHRAISVSVASNVPGFREPVCFVEKDLDELLKHMFDYLEEISLEVQELAEAKWGWIKTALGKKRDQWEKEPMQTDEDQSFANGDTMMKNALNSLFGELEGYMTQVPVLGFNSARYDLNLVKQKLAMYMQLHREEEERPFVVKKNNAYVCLSNSHLKFLDMSQFLGPGTSYAKFLKAYQIPEGKGYFPYEWFDDVGKLDHPSLPPHSAFYSSLKQKNITEEEYTFCQNIWREHKMERFEQFLEWYNNLDVGPFVDAVEKFQRFFFEKGLDVFKIAISIPGISRRLLYQTAKKAGANFALFDEQNKDLHKKFKDNLVGGASIVFTRHHKAGETSIRGGEERCRKVVGYDANALYLWALGENMCVGAFVRRKRETGFLAECRDRYMMAYHWMNHLTKTTEYDIKHKLNQGCEKRVGKYLMDGFCPATNTLFEFEGCYHHGHQCYLTRQITDERWLKERDDKYKKTMEKIEYVKNQGYNVEVMWECDFKKVQNKPEVKETIEQGRPKFYKRYPRTVSEERLLQAVRQDDIFGMLEVDIRVPERWPKGMEKSMTPYEYFQEMSPLFCNAEIPFEAFGPHMQEHVEKNGLSKNPRKLLVGGMKAEKMLIATPLLRWYLEHGMEVTCVHEVIEFQGQRCFESFVRDVTAARRMGDVNKDTLMIGETFKVVGNSGYGSLCLDKTKHRQVKYVQGEHAAGRLVNDPLFRKMECISQEDMYYEVELAKPNITLDIPIQLAYIILQYAKLRMLEFYYDCLDKYLDRKHFELIETDTDSLYFAISEDTLDKVIKKDLTPEFEHALKGYCDQPEITAKDHYFPRTCCDKHAKHDKRTPGLFKLEFEGLETVALNSKSYVVSNPTSDDEKVKFSCKGVNKATVTEPLKTYQNVLNTTQTISANNIGFRAKNNTIFTYEQEKVGWSYFYIKRRVLGDGIHTVPLDITLCPVTQNDDKMKEQ